MLQFSDTTNKNGIIQRIEFDTELGDGTITSDPTLFSQITSIINAGMSKATSIIITADGRWTWDDTSQTDQSVATTNIVAGQNDYTILNNTPDENKDYLKPERIEIKDGNGIWMRLYERDLKRYRGSITQDRTVSGVPTSYDFNGVSIFLDAVPDYNSTSGLKIWFSRAQINFDTNDTSKKPGFASIFHEYPVLYTLYHWGKTKALSNVHIYKRDLEQMERDMAMFYSKRDESKPNLLQRRYKSYK